MKSSKIKIKKGKKKEKPKFIKTTFTCPKCKTINDVSASGYGNHLRSCKGCSEQIMFEYEAPLRHYSQLSEDKISKLPEDLQEQVRKEIQEIKDREELERKNPDLKKERLAMEKKNKPTDLITTRGQMIIAKMIEEGLNIDTDDPDEDLNNKKRFIEIFKEVTGQDINIEDL
jgi:transcription elongation factor Elf1